MTKVIPNEKQQECIEATEGKYMVLAGPGTGKTFTITQRIKSMLNSGIEPETILCLTYSIAAANEMRERIIKSMGEKAAFVNVYTYHAFCNMLITQYPEQFNFSSDIKLITSLDEQRLMKETIDEVRPETWIASDWSDKYFKVGILTDRVKKIKKLRINKEEYLSYVDKNPEYMPKIKQFEDEIYEREQAGKTKNKTKYDGIEKIKKKIEKAKELWDVFEIYTRKMRQNNMIDFDDMINFVLEQFECDKTFLKTIAQNYGYVLVDEYQDTNPSQNALIFNLLEGMEKQNVFVVGDDDQIIYEFQGAKNDNLENFLLKYPDTKVICLIENNRSAQNILDLGYKLIKQDKTRLEANALFKKYSITKKLTAKNEDIIQKERKIRKLIFGDYLQECNHIADDIENLINTNCPLNDKGEKQLSKIAIIARKHDGLAPFIELLENRGIPCQTYGAKSIFLISSCSLIYLYMKVLFNPILYGDKLFGLLLTEPFKIDNEDYVKLYKEGQTNKKDFISNMRTFDNWNTPERIQNFLETFDYLREFCTANNLRKSVIEIINRTGILEFFLKTKYNKYENIQGVKKVVDEASGLMENNPAARLKDFLDYLDMALTNKTDICIENKDLPVRNAVQLITYHNSKGKEFDHVYLPNLTSEVWENFDGDSKEKLITELPLSDEEKLLKKDTELLKLLFVGITRAKYGLTLSFSNKNGKETKQFTKYITGIGDFDFETEQLEYNEDDFVNEYVRSVSRITLDNREFLKNEIQTKIDKLVLSPSRLNDYISCPKKFFYTKILEIDIEDKQWDNANFGTVMHEIFETAAKTAKETGKYPEYEEVQKLFDKLTAETVFSSETAQEHFIERGKRALENYYPHFVQTTPERIKDLEFSFNCVLTEDIPLTGKIDRIEINNDGTFGLYDYKTGKPAKEKEVATGGEKEHYYNQLCFYKYAFEKLTGKKVSQTGLIYIEQHQNSVYKELTSEDNEYIENKIKEVYQNISDFKFDCSPLKSEKNSGPCRYCDYKQLCDLDVI